MPIYEIHESHGIHEKREIDKSKGSRRPRRRVVVRLDVRALWDRLDTLNRSQRWLARKIGVSPGYLSELVGEGRAPSGRIRRRMQRALGVEDFRELFILEEHHDQ